MRQPKPYFKKSHQAWYVNIGSRQIRLAEDEKEAWKEYHKVMAGKIDIGRDPTLNDLFLAFTCWSERNHKPDTREFYRMYQVSLIVAVGPRRRVSQVLPRHVSAGLMTIGLSMTS